MSEYTAEDFAYAKFAEHPRGGRTHRTEFGWHMGDGIYLKDKDMAQHGWRPYREHAPLTLDTLREAWENAEQSEDCRIGDALIRRLSSRDFAMYEATAESHSLIPDMVRVHERAPQPQPWEDLADVLRQWDATLETGHSTDSMARWFHERGVRVTGGDEA